MEKVADAEEVQQSEAERISFDEVGYRDGGPEKRLVVVPVDFVYQDERFQGMCRRLLTESDHEWSTSYIVDTYEENMEKRIHTVCDAIHDCCSDGAVYGQ